HGIRASYVLMDSWFSSVDMIKSIRGIGQGAMHVIALVKMGNQKYEVAGKQLHLRQIILLLGDLGVRYLSQYSCRHCEVRSSRQYAMSVSCLGDCFVPRNDELGRIPLSLLLRV
ncbi:MAG: hypothetical protein LBT83_07445, partial [Tannerella sp.]|nr:hypothetical protein [Tannerella sp.]